MLTLGQVSPEISRIGPDRTSTIQTLLVELTAVAGLGIAAELFNVDQVFYNRDSPYPSVDGDAEGSPVVHLPLARLAPPSAVTQIRNSMNLPGLSMSQAIGRRTSFSEEEELGVVEETAALA